MYTLEIYLYGMKKIMSIEYKYKYKNNKNI